MASNLNNIVRLSDFDCSKSRRPDERKRCTKDVAVDDVGRSIAFGGGGKNGELVEEKKNNRFEHYAHTVFLGSTRNARVVTRKIKIKIKLIKSILCKCVRARSVPGYTGIPGIYVLCIIFIYI